MILFPAIDLLDGKCVRLYQGDYEKRTDYNNSPVSQAIKFQEQGAKYLHIVDLNAAKDGDRRNLDLINRISSLTNLKIQLGGGIRSMEALEDSFSAGVWRCVIGTAAIKNPEFLEEALNIYGDRIAVAADCYGEYLATDGWKNTSKLLLDDFVAELAIKKCRTIIYTDISRDGALTGPNFSRLESLIASSNMDIVLSAGVSHNSDIVKAEHIGAAAVITGKALYEGKIDLAKCINYLQILEESR